jgi:DNA-directed RNA polymerase subunit E'/Rpb7
LGLARSDTAGKSVADTGAAVHRGSLDGLIHTAFIHDFSNYAPAAEKDRLAIENGHLSICRA